MALHFNTNLPNVANQYIRLLKIKVSTTTLGNRLEQNPFYPSLFSISDTFNKLNVPNQAFEITVKDLPQFEAPFITYYNTPANGNDFILVTKNGANEVSFITDGTKAKTVTKDTFEKNWQKVVLVAEANSLSGEKDYELSLKDEKIKKRSQWFLNTGIAAIVLLLICMFVVNATTNLLLPAIVLVALKLFGLTVAILLLTYEVDKTNAFVKNICTAGNQTNCDAVLNSKAAKFLGMSWSEAGFFYFASSTLFLLITPVTQVAFLLLAIASTLAAAYIPFSIYYQWKVVKQWCPLCLTVQAVLLLEIIWAIVNVWLSPASFSASMASGFVIQTAIIIVLPVVSWYLIKPLLLKAKDERLYENAYKRLLYSPHVFNGLLKQQDTAPDGWQQLGINIGNPQAENTIVKVCNPYCGPCASAHPILEEIIHQNKNVNLKIIFATPSLETDKSFKPVQHLLAIASMRNLMQTQQALDDWYLPKHKDYEVFADKYPLNGTLKEQTEKIASMKKWCDDAGITHTPTLFVNGKRVPEAYNIEQLKNIF